MIASEDTLADPADPPESGPPAPKPETPAPTTPVETDESSAAAERAAIDGDEPPLFDKPLRDLTLTEALTPAPGYFAKLRPAALMGGLFLPGAIACRATVGATITRVVHPGQAPPENRYRPSKKLADLIRCRDMTCRFPGCRVPASQTDVDHTIPWPHGPTAASNLKCVCRRHHLLKTFWGGENGWRDRQLDDGTAAVDTTYSRRSGVVRMVGETGNWTTAPSSGPHPTAKSSSPRRSADCCSPN
ncbi:HNH endonuclease signature motif containing protein [Mycobacterium yunnanensis]|uniref:HNH endonuclease signature motif containing protein n=1 Tax=Mycobacterium yunnanensis TaxID=368477 RepID=UPI0021F31FE9|nr:HNH endonuclease signature motif containing protein [Mycobacterium yunnanensis]